MDQRNRTRFRTVSTLAVMACGLSLCALPNLTYAQRTIIEEEPAATERAREAERAREREAARARAAERERDIERAKRDNAVYDRRDYYKRPGEMYVAGFGGYTFAGTGFTNIDNSNVPGVPNTNSINHTDSAIYGIKIGYFLPNRLNWLGFEVEGFNTNPHLKESAGLGTPGLNNAVGSHLRVTTVAFNAIIRGKWMCDRRDRRDWDARRAARDPRDPAYRDPRDPGRVTDPGNDYGNDYGERRSEFCRLQPYVGAGVGIFFAETSINGGPSSTDNGVVGFNGLGGLRYYFTEHVAAFAEYKYQRASFNFDNAGQSGRTLNGDYSANSVVGGLSLHF
ncbi:MAG TPA: hypothetical protein VJ692_02635 [Nitrospiraceae bacterium]|nr:hypothetical protein [Nitrospiraceae bacterium]